MEPELRASSITIDKVLKICEANAKGRFMEQDEDGVYFIHANQGHALTSVDPDQLMTPIQCWRKSLGGGTVLRIHACSLTQLVPTLVSWRAIPHQSDSLWGSHARSQWSVHSFGARWPRTKGLDGPMWPSSPSHAVLMAHLPRWTLLLEFLAPTFPGKLARLYF